MDKKLHVPFDNQDVAVLTKLNELAERRGLKPYDFVATFRPVDDEAWALTFEVPAQGNALREERFDKMLNDLGIPADSGKLTGGTADIIDALDRAIAMSPRNRIR